MNDFTTRFRAWMDERRMRASDVADALFVTEQAVRNWRSAGVPARRQAQLADWMASQDAVDQGDPIDILRSRPLVVEPTPEEWHAWEDAAFAARKKLTDWARDGLNELAKARGYDTPLNPVSSLRLNEPPADPSGNAATTADDASGIERLPTPRNEETA